MNSYVSNVSDRITGITGEPDKVHAMAKAFGIYGARWTSRAATTRWTTPRRCILLDASGDFRRHHRL